MNETVFKNHINKNVLQNLENLCQQKRFYEFYPNSELHFNVCFLCSGAELMRDNLTDDKSSTKIIIDSDNLCQNCKAVAGQNPALFSWIFNIINNHCMIFHDESLVPKLPQAEPQSALIL